MNSKRIANALIVVCLLVAVGLWWAKLRPAEKAAAVQEAAPSPRPTQIAVQIEPPVAESAETVAPPTVDPAVLQAVATVVAELQRQAEVPPEAQIKTTRDLTQLMSTYDRNMNAGFDATEIQAMQVADSAKAAEALKWDANGDGRIDGTELRAWRAALAAP